LLCGECEKRWPMACEKLRQLMVDRHRSYAPCAEAGACASDERQSEWFFRLRFAGPGNIN